MPISAANDFDFITNLNPETIDLVHIVQCDVGDGHTTDFDWVNHCDWVDGSL